MSDRMQDICRGNDSKSDYVDVLFGVKPGRLDDHHGLIVSDRAECPVCATPLVRPAGFQHVRATWDDDGAQHEPFLVCTLCDAKLCSVEEGDTFDVLVATVASHKCGEEQ